MAGTFSNSWPIRIHIVTTIIALTNINEIQAIVGGQYVNSMNDLVPLVQVQCNTKRCGGWAIGRSIIVTSANCVIFKNKNQKWSKKCDDIQVRAGSLFWGWGKIYEVKDIIHSSQNNDYIYNVNRNNQLAVLKLTGDVLTAQQSYSSYSTIVKSDNLFNYALKEGVFVGWGKTMKLPIRKYAAFFQKTVYPEQLKSMSMIMPNFHFGRNYPVVFMVLSRKGNEETPFSGDEGCPLIVDGKAVGIAILVPNKYNIKKSATVFTAFKEVITWEDSDRIHLE